MLLESAIDGLPDRYRSVFVMRFVEEMSTAETAECLEISEEAVKVRVLRARRMLRRRLYEELQAVSISAFQFLGPRCDRATAAVLYRLGIPARNRRTHAPTMKGAENDPT